MNNKKIRYFRNKIDKLDEKIFHLIKERTKVVKHMLKLKKHKKQIVDHQRIDEVIRKIKKLSLRNKIDSKITVRIWKSIIWSYVNFQRKNFKKK